MELEEELKGRNEFWDSVRGALMLIVVFGHALQRCNGMDPNDPLQLVIRTFQMKGLMFVSGYVFAYSRADDLGKYMLSKVRRLLVPYVLWVIPVWLALALAHTFPLTPQSLLKELVQSNFWFLRILFLIFVAFVPYVLANKMRGGVVAGLVGIPVSLGIAYGLSEVDGWNATFHYAQYFSLGLVLHLIYRNEIFASLGNKWLVWVGRRSLAIYAIHWNLLFAYFPYRRLHLDWPTNCDINLYIRAVMLFLLWTAITVSIIFLHEKLIESAFQRGR